MNDVTREQLLGYLLGALDDTEREDVERQLDANPDWQVELQALMASLEPLAASYEEVEPPSGLAERTCALIAERCAQFAVTPASNSRQQAMQRDVRRSNRWTIADVVVAAGICLAAALLFFPVISNSRYHARLLACERKLTELGFSLINYSEQVGDGYFPEVPIEGNRAFVGIYGPILVDAGYLTDESRVICPSSTLAMERDRWQMPTLLQIDEASGVALVLLQRTAGGTYGYSLGVIVDGRHRSPRNEGRAHFALMADTPMLYTAGHRSLNHNGRGQNILFEDGHVRYVVDRRYIDHWDDPFLNRLGRMEAGVDANDSVIGPGPASPFLSNVSNKWPAR